MGEAMIERRWVDLSLVELLKEVSEKEWGYIDPPSDSPVMPYGIVLPTDSMPESASFDDPHSEFDFFYDLRCVADNPDGVAWLSFLTSRVMVERAGISYAYPLVVTDREGEEQEVDVQWRLLVSGGAIIPTGDKLYQCTDQYLIRANGPL